MQSNFNPKVTCLSIAGSDPGGGAGIQGDLKTFSACGIFGMAALSALTAQNSHEVRGVHVVPADFLALQLETLFDDFPIHGAKTGMLATAELVRVVADAFRRRASVPLVVDPVMVSSTGARLLAEDAEQAVVRELLPCATVVTPNAGEAEVLVGFAIGDVASARRAAERLRELGAKAALVKGGDSLYGESDVVDVFADAEGTVELRSPRLPAGNSHGSGCALAAALAAALAQGVELRAAVEFARRFVYRGLENPAKFGHGGAAVNHLHSVTPFGFGAEGAKS